MLIIKRFFIINIVFFQILLAHRQISKGKLTKDEFGKLLRHKLERLGPTFIKIGQILSLRPDLVPIEYCMALRDLLDKTEEIPFDEVMEIIRKELGQNPKKVFSHISKNPIGSASLAQVYKGKLLTGEYVAIKIKKPDVEKLVKTDIRILKVLNFFITTFFRESINSTTIITDLQGILDKELNFLKEASNIERFAEIFKEFSYVKSPLVYWDFVTNSILVMELIPGIKLSEVFNAIDKNPSLRNLDEIEVKGLVINKRKLTKQLVSVVAHSVFDAGFFHADPHPANIILTFDKKVAYIDFGMVGDLLVSEKVLFREVVFCIATKDDEKLLEVLIEYNNMMGKGSPDMAAKMSLRHMLHDLLGQFVSSDQTNFPITKFLYSLGGMSFKYHFPPPSFLMLISKQVFTLEGLATYLYPKLNAVEEFKPYVYSYRTKDALKQFSNEKLMHMLEESLTLGTTLPENLNTIINNIKDEGLVNLSSKKRGVNRRPYFFVLTAYLIFLGFVLEYNSAFRELTLLLWGSILALVILFYFIFFKNNG